MFEYEEVVTWFQVLNAREPTIGKCKGLAACAGEHTRKIVVESEFDQGGVWIFPEPWFVGRVVGL